MSERIAHEEPLCVVCLMDSKYTPTQHRHHIEKIKDAPDKRMDRENVLSVCAAHNVELDAMYERNRLEYGKWIKAIRDAMRTREANV